LDSFSIYSTDYSSLPSFFCYRQTKNFFQDFCILVSKADYSSQIKSSQIKSSPHDVMFDKLRPCAVIGAAVLVAAVLFEGLSLPTSAVLSAAGRYGLHATVLA
jgi:hypothetical protein